MDGRLANLSDLGGALTEVQQPFCSSLVGSLIFSMTAIPNF